MSNYKIKGAGIDTSTINWAIPQKYMSGFDYVLTDITANNEYLLNIPLTATLLVRSGYQDWLEDGLSSHLNALGRDYCDLLLLDEGVELINDTALMINSGLVKEIGIFSVNSDLEKIKLTAKSMSEGGVALTYIVINVCPFEFPLDVLDWAKENDIMIISTNPIGGYLNAPRNIMTFSVPYLLGFSATYADIVLVSGRDVFSSGQSAEYLRGLIGKESSPIYGLKKKVSKGIKPLKEAVQVIAKVTDNAEIPINNVVTGDSGFIGGLEYELKLGKADTILPEIDDWSDDSEDKDLLEVKVLLETLHYPTDGNDLVMFSRARLSAIRYLELLFPDYVQSYVKFGDGLFIINLVRPAKTVGKLWWKKHYPEIIRSFVIIMSDHKPRLYELQERKLRFLTDSINKIEKEDINQKKTN